MIDDAVKKLAKAPNFATLTTLLPDGQPQTSVMWVDCDDEHVLINTEVHRQKFKDIEREPRVTVAIWNKDNPYEYVEVRGRVMATTRGDAARAHIDELSDKYTGHPYDASTIESERVLVRIAPDRQRSQG
ncbi:MAG: PPOX class F420-dependent oxidoreductase [Acidimicrobiales bacterium]